MGDARDREPFAASGARMTPPDPLRIDRMMLHGGTVAGRVCRSPGWIERCVTPASSADELRRYGCQWVVPDIAFGKPKGWARLERNACGWRRGREATTIYHSSAPTRPCDYCWQLPQRRSAGCLRRAPCVKWSLRASCRYCGPPALRLKLPSYLAAIFTLNVGRGYRLWNECADGWTD